MRDYKELQEVDLKLFLQSGSGIKNDNLVIKPYKLEEIRDYGYSYYMRNLQWISITIDDFISSVEDDGKRAVLEGQRANLRTFDFYTKFGGQELLDSIIDVFKMLFRTDDVRFLDNGIIALDFMKKGILYKDEDGEIKVNEEVLKSLPEDKLTIIDRENFDYIVNIVKIQNYLKKPVANDKEENPVDEETRKLMKEMEEHRKRVEAKKKAKKLSEGAEQEDTDISDIISSVSSKSNSINRLNIWEFTIYQIYDEYARLELIDNYDFSIRAMMAGAEKVDLRHWSSRL